MVGPWEPVGLCPAGPKEQEIRRPAPSAGFSEHGLGIVRVRAALKAMQQQEPRRVERRTIQSDKLKEIAIGRVESLDARRDVRLTSPHPPPQRRAVRVGKPPSRTVWMHRFVAQGDERERKLSANTKKARRFSRRVV